MIKLIPFVKLYNSFEGEYVWVTESMHNGHFGIVFNLGNWWRRVFFARIGLQLLGSDELAGIVFAEWCQAQYAHLVAAVAVLALCNLRGQFFSQIDLPE